MFFSPVFLWALAGLLLIGSEFLIPGFVIFFFGVGALVTSLFSGLVPGISERLGIQTILWLASSGFLLAILRRYLSRVFKGRLLPRENRGVIGQTVEIIEPVAPDKPGRVRFQGTSWNAESYTEEFHVGDSAEIIKQEGLTLIITKSILNRS